MQEKPYDSGATLWPVLFVIRLCFHHNGRSVIFREPADGSRSRDAGAAAVDDWE